MHNTTGMTMTQPQNSLPAVAHLLAWPVAAAVKRRCVLRATTLLCLALLCPTVRGHGDDPLTAAVHVDDAQRFARLFSAGTTSTAELQNGYLDGAGRGVQVFTPHRIENAANLAAAVADRQADYAHAIATCLPLAQALNAELRAVYLAYRGMLPEKPLPAVHLVFGAANSGGTASPDAQVIGLEVMCGRGTSPEAFRAGMRRIFAHETVHSWQTQPGSEPADLLIYAALAEGVPDLLAELVTGLAPSPERAAFGGAREALIWRQFEADRVAVLAGDKTVLRRWFGNAGATLDGVAQGWPSELGYWVGQQIARAYFERASDKRTALRELIDNRDPGAVLQASGYAPRQGRFRCKSGQVAQAAAKPTCTWLRPPCLAR